MKEFFDNLFSQWWGITLFVIACLLALVVISAILYKPFFKRFYDFILSLIAVIILSPILLMLTVVGAVKMKGNPFFTQLRPGKNGKVFRLIKFRTMTCQKDKDGNLLPDEVRLTKYGKFLRSTSLDELPELINILIGNMSIVGPRPLLVEYLPLYNKEQRRRHNVRPGLTGWAQANGRNALSWEDKFNYDIYYVEHLSLFMDIKVLFKTVLSVFKREGISSSTSATMEYFIGTPEVGEKRAVIISAFRSEMRVDRVSEVLKNRGYKVTLITSDFDHTLKEYISIDKEDCRVIHAKPYFKNVSVKRLLSHMDFAKKAVKECREIDPHLIYALVPPNSIAKQSVTFSKKSGAKVILDIIDMWPESLPVAGLKKQIMSLPFSIWRKRRDKYLKGADGVVFECGLYERELTNKKVKLPSNRQVVYLSQDATKDLSHPADVENINICYLGSINNIIDVDKICEIVSSINKVKPVTVKIIGGGEKEEEFVARLKEVGVTVEFFGKVFDEEKKAEIIGSCHFGLNIMKDCVKVGLTIKSLDYLKYGLPLLNNIKGDTYSLVEEQRIGVNVDNVDDVGKVVATTTIDDLKATFLNCERVFLNVFERSVQDNKLNDFLEGVRA